MPTSTSPWSCGTPLSIGLAALAAAVAAYFCGCFNGAVIVSKYILRDDVRNHGSGNAGLTNFLRTFGGPLTVVVVLCDVLKAVVAVKVGVWLFSYVPMPLSVVDLPAVSPLYLFAKYWSALFCLLGHMYPCMFGFKGGKGILSGGTIAIMLDPRLALLVWGLFLAAVLLTRFVSLGSVLAAAAFPIGTWLFVSHDPSIFGFSLFIGLLVVWKHRANIGRLLRGEESKLTIHKKK